MLQYAITTSDGHDEDWEYFTTHSEAVRRFEFLKHNESDIHLYELNPKENNYEVIDSFWLGDYQCPECNGDEVYYFGETMVCGDCNHKDDIKEFEK